MRAHCWQSRVQKSNLIIDAVVLWIPSLAAANGWCADDSVKALIDPLVNCITSKGRAELGEVTEASGEGPQQHQSPPLPTVLAWGARVAQPGGRTLDCKGKDVGLGQLPARNLETLLQQEGPSKPEDPDLDLGCDWPSPKTITMNCLYSTVPTAPTQGHIQRTWTGFTKDPIAAPPPASALGSWSVSISLPLFSSQDLCFRRFETCRVVWWR